MTNFITVLLVVIVVFVGGYFAYEKNTQRQADTAAGVSPSGTSQGKLMSVEAYVTQNISALSPVQAVLGGTFHVTEIEVEPNERKGTVKYEDGHMSYTANFTYTSNDRTGHTITSFVVKD